MKVVYYAKFVWFWSIFITSTNLVSQTDNHHPFSCDEYENIRFRGIPLKNIKNENIVEMLLKLKKKFPQSFQYETIGQSVQKRPIHLVRLGKGDTKILLWSQMHGDEPTATAALFDVFNYLMTYKDKAFVRNILSKTTILAVPMLNPDGAEKFTRRNAQGLDINRDARDRQTPEGKILYRLQKKIRPDFGFNLHDQNARRTVGKTNKLVAISLMAPPFDQGDNDNPVRIRAKKIVTVIYHALGPYLYGHISKYDAEYMPRSFGDSMQNWGVSTILIESGGWTRNRGEFLQKMNFIALMTSFHAIANGNYERANPALYDLLPENDRNLYDLLIRDVMVFDGTGIPPFRTDVAINYDSENTGHIADMGDLDIFAAKDTIKGDDFYLTPGLVGFIHDMALEEKEIVDKLKKMLEKGFTTILFSFRKVQINTMSRLGKAIDDSLPPANLGSVLYLDEKLRSHSDTLQVLKALAKNMIGLVGKESTFNAESFSSYTKKPAVLLSDIHLKKNLNSFDAEQIKSLTRDHAEQWKIPGRGTIRIGQIADIVLFTRDTQPRVHTIFIKGHPIWKEDEWRNSPVKGEHWFPNKEINQNSRNPNSKSRFPIIRLHHAK